MKFFYQIIVVLALLQTAFTAEPIALWAFPDGMPVSKTAHLGAVAYHIKGVESVSFLLDGNPVLTVDEESVNPETGEYEFVCPVDTSTLTEGASHYLTAEVTPIEGEVSLLAARRIWIDNEDDEASWYVDAVNGSDASGDGSELNPFATISEAFSSASGGDAIYLFSGDYDSGIGERYGFEQYVTVQPKAGESPRIVSSDYIRADYIHFKDILFDWSEMEPTTESGGYNTGVLQSWNVRWLWMSDCELRTVANSSANYMRGVKIWTKNPESLCFERTTMRDLNLAFAVPENTILRQNIVGPGITSDAFDYDAYNLITGNQIFGIQAPHLYIDSAAQEPFDLSAQPTLDIFYDEYNSGDYAVYSLTNLGATASDESSVGIDELVAQMMADEHFSSKLTALATNGHLRIQSNRTNYPQHLYVEGAAENLFDFAVTSSNPAEGSGQHADVFQTWGGPKTNVIIRNNHSWNNDAQNLLSESDHVNFAFINNMMDNRAEASWCINLNDKKLTNILMAHNTIWDRNNALVLNNNPCEDFYFVNNLLGANFGDADKFTLGAYMDYNMYNYRDVATPLGSHSFDINPKNIVPIPLTNLFENLSFTYDSTLNQYDYTTPDGKFYLSENAVVRNAGTALPHIRYDLDWNLRDRAPDIGAREFIPTALSAFVKADRVSGRAPLSVAFSGTLSGGPDPIRSYAWDFDDGITATNGVASHLYVFPGSYSASLQVTDTEGVQKTHSRKITVYPRAPNGLIFGLTFDGESDDYSPGKLTPIWSEQPVYTHGLFGQAALFDAGEDRYLEQPHHTAFDHLDEITLCVWVKKNRASDSGYLFHKHNVFYLEILDDSLKGYMNASNDGLVRLNWSTNAMNNTEWNHIAYTYNGSEMTIYVNGEKGLSVPLSGTLNHDPSRDLYIGKDPWGSALNGVLDDIQVYNYALSDSEIKERAIRPYRYQDFLVDHFSAEEISAGIITAPDADPDQDGMKNLEEYHAGTNPRNKQKRAFSGLLVENDSIHLGLNRRMGAIDCAYLWETSTNLTDWSMFVPEREEVVGRTNSVENIYSVLTNTPQSSAFFRMKIYSRPDIRTD